MKIQILFIILFSITVSANSSEACNPEGSHSDDWWFVPDLGIGELIVGILIVIGTVGVLIPQLVKLIVKRSSEGLSSIFVSLVTINVTCGFINSLIINYPYIQSCPHVGYDVCIPALSSLFQCFFLMLTWMTIYVSLIIFYKDKTSKQWKWVYGTFIGFIVLTIVLIVVMILSVTVLDNCSTFSLVYAHICGLVGVVFVCIQFLPQIYTTYKNKSSGSLSLAANISQAIGLIVVVFFMAFSTGQDISAYLKFIVTIVIMTIISIMQIYYDFIMPKIGKKVVDNNGEYSKLIDDTV